MKQFKTEEKVQINIKKKLKQTRTNKKVRKKYKDTIDICQITS